MMVTSREKQRELNRHRRWLEKNRDAKKDFKDNWRKAKCDDVFEELDNGDVKFKH